MCPAVPTMMLLRGALIKLCGEVFGLLKIDAKGKSRGGQIGRFANTAADGLRFCGGNFFHYGLRRRAWIFGSDDRASHDHVIGSRFDRFGWSGGTRLIVFFPFTG